ncbi:MAG: hypothetical protein ACLGSH_09780 [Acidobacteriota bacterium]
MRALHVCLMAQMSAAAALVLIGCGGSPTRKLLSLTITPSAGAPGTGSSQVQFVATGHYNTAPYTVTPLQANWGRFNWPVATIAETGLAQCTAAGTTIIEAWVDTPQGPGPVCNVIDPAGRVCAEGVGAKAQLTCP